MTDRRTFLSASSFALSSLVLAETLGSDPPRLPPGRLKQSACRWPYRQMPLPDFCRAAQGLGLAGVDLLGADEWETVREHGLVRSEEHTSELQSQSNLVCRLLLENKKELPSLRARVRHTDTSTGRT